MSSLASRLAMLRKQAGSTAPQESPLKRLPQIAQTGTALTPASLPSHRPQTGTALARPPRERTSPCVGAASAAMGARDLAALRRMAGVRERLIKPFAPARPHTRDVPGEEISPGLRYIEQRFAWNEPPAELDLTFARLTTARREHLLHFDTETTGLAGGTGTRAFMIGAADWHEGALRVRQLYMTAMAAESAMLRAFAQWIHAETVLVSYNGKSYDAPLLATRYRLARMANPLLGLTHVDLLHPMRRRYRQVWENCKMQTAERRLLRIVREDDLPGSEAPRAWLTYLRGGSSADLVRVAEHNLQDVRSLSGLLVAAHGWGVQDVSPGCDEN